MDELVREIPLPNSRPAIIDADDFERLSFYKWSLRGTKNKARPAAKINGKSTYMHRVVLGVTDGFVDHINGDPLDNRKQNLRSCTLSQNAKNRGPNKFASSKYKGVRWHKKGEKWMAAIRCDGVQHWLGLFVNELEAARAYDAAAIRLHGDFARTNFGLTVGETMEIESISKRELFAAMAMQGLCSGKPDMMCHERAAYAVEHADDLIAALEAAK